MVARKIYLCVLICLLLIVKPVIAEQGIDLNLLQGIPNVARINQISTKPSQKMPRRRMRPFVRLPPAWCLAR